MRRLRPRPSLFMLWLAMLLLVTAWVGWGAGSTALNGFAQSTAVPPYLPSDQLLAAPRGSVDQTLRIAQLNGALRYPDVQLYVNEVYSLAPQVGLDPAVVVAQSAVETGWWRTDNWVDYANPAGIGITSSGAQSKDFENGTNAARAHIVHLFVYAVGAIPADHILEPYKSLDPRYQAAIDAGYAGIADTIDDLTGRWAVDTSYGQKIAGRANDIFLRTRPTNYGASSGAPNSALADDGKTTTSWLTPAGSSPPANAYAFYDLGSVKPIGSIRWVMGVTGFADQVQIQVSTDLSSWTTLATITNSPVGAWQELSTSTVGRYVRFFFLNPNGDLQLGGLAEVHFWPPTTAEIPWQFPTTPVAGGPTPTPSGPATVTLSTNRGTVGSSVRVSISGYSPGQAVQVQWKTATQTTVLMDATGRTSVTIQIPPTRIGTYPIRAVAGDRIASAYFEIVPRISISPGQAARGATVSVYLRGYEKNEDVRIRWVRGNGWVDVGTVRTSNSGSATINVRVPSWVPDGPTKVRGDAPSARAQTNAFVVSGGGFTASAAGTPTATATATPTAAATPDGTPASDASPIAVEETPYAIVEPTLEPTLEPILPVETPTLEPTATLEPTPTEEASPSALDGTPTDG